MFNTVLVLLFSLFFFVNATPIPVKRDGDVKYVFAHFMVGNSYPYTLDTWLKDISLAQANGIDAFALNVGSDSWQPQQVANAYQAAQQLNNGFKLFLSLDMTVLGCGSPADGQKLVNWVSQYVDHPNQFKYPPSDPKAFVSTFSGETCQFGQGSVAQGWATQFKNPLSSKITFVPAFFGDLNAWGSNGIGNVVDGNFNWNSAWPASTTTSTLSTVLNAVGATISSILHQPLTSSGRQAVQNVVGSLDSDNQQIAALNNLGGNKIYLAGHSPWFFTHYGKDSFNKNWIYLADTLYPTRWQSLVDNRDQFNLVEVITWNDYGESHYIAPVDGAQPNSQSWVDGFDHSAWLDMTQFYSTYFKTGQQPEITDDKVYVWSRGQPKDANAPDPVGKPTNADMVLDSFFALVLAKEPGTVTLSSGSSSQSFPVDAGVTQLSLPFSVGNGIKAVLNRSGQDVVTVAPEGFTITGNPQIYNFNAMVAMGSSAPQN